MALSVHAQEAADSGRWDYHLSVGSSVVSFGGHGQAYGWVAPTVNYRANERLTLSGGFAMVGSLLDSYRVVGLNGRSLAPRKQGTRLGAVRVAAEYQVNDRLWLWAEIAHASGYFQPWWKPDGSAMPADITALSGGFDYKLAAGSLLSMHFTFIRDRYGSLPHLLPYGYTDPFRTDFDNPFLPFAY